MGWDFDKRPAASRYMAGYVLGYIQILLFFVQDWGSHPKHVSVGGVSVGLSMLLCSWRPNPSILLLKIQQLYFNIVPKM